MNNGVKTAVQVVSSFHIRVDVSVKSEVLCCRSACFSPLTIRKIQHDKEIRMSEF